MPPTYRRLLGSRLYLHTWVRLIFSAGTIAGALFARHVVGIQNLPVRSLVLLGLVVALYNTFFWLIARRHRDLEKFTPATYQRLLAAMYGVILLDFLGLTVGVWLVGGSRSPFLVFYMLHVILSCLMLSRRAAIAFTVLAYGLLASLVVGEWSGVIPPHQPVGAVAGAGPLDGRYAVTMLGVFALLFGLTAYLLLESVSLLRHGEQRIQLAGAELSRLSGLRRDFLHIAVHNLKSPIGAATMFLRNLKSGRAGPVTDTQGEWLDRALQRLDGMTEFLQNLLVLSSLETEMIEDEVTEVDVGELLEEIVKEYRDLAEERQQTLSFEAERYLPRASGIKRLLREAVVNYVANATKYTPNGGRIVIRARYLAPYVRIEVEDNGVGIAAEDQAKLFGEYVRLDQRGLHAAWPGGTGLGLSIVKRVAEGLGGRVGVESESGQGSTFYLELPAIGS